MPKLEHGSQFSTPSPGQLLKQKTRQPSPKTEVDRHAPTQAGVAVPCDPFRPNAFAQALMERGVMLAPLLVQWKFKVVAAKPFAKWLKTKEVLLSDARLTVNGNTEGVHYFGTYIAQEAGGGRDAPPVSEPVDCQTLWGFSSEAAMTHMFDLCRGRVDRVTIVESDLKDFVVGLKGHIKQAGQIDPAGGAHFSQTVLLAPAAM